MTKVVLAFCFVFAVGTIELASRQAPQTWEQQVFTTWKSLHDKILVMAKDTVFPDEKLSSKPHPDSRTVLDEFRHVTIGLEMTTAQLAGTQFDYMARVKADESKPRTRASVVAEMEAAMAASYAAVQKDPKPLLIFWIDHQAEHYGKLVSNYRMNNIVPPISRPRGRGLQGATRLVAAYRLRAGRFPVAGRSVGRLRAEHPVRGQALHLVPPENARRHE